MNYENYEWGKGECHGKEQNARIFVCIIWTFVSRKIQYIHCMGLCSVGKPSFLFLSFSPFELLVTRTAR